MVSGAGLGVSPRSPLHYKAVPQGLKRHRVGTTRLGPAARARKSRGARAAVSFQLSPAGSARPRMASLKPSNSGLATATEEYVPKIMPASSAKLNA